MKFVIAQLFAIATLFSFNAHALVGEFINEPSIGSGSKMQLHLFNAAGVIDCGSDLCFRLDVYIDGEQVARIGASPGQKNGWSDFPGSWTPAFNETSFDSGRLMGAGYVSHRGDSMPYAMFINYGNGGFAVHGHGGVNGTFQSHGCIRIETPNAKILNGWMKKVYKNGGKATITAEDTHP